MITEQEVPRILKELGYKSKEMFKSMHRINDSQFMSHLDFVAYLEKVGPYYDKPSYDW